jgi:pyruvate dehydrogenase E2 component (dihydrolipoamide acetyltransferase)
MADEIVMPRLSDSMEEGTVLRWLKSVGDEVAVGDELVEIETDKANMVYEADLAGTLVEVIAQEGDTLPVGETIARVGEAGEVVSDGGGGAGAAAAAERAGAEDDGEAQTADEPAIEHRSAAAAAPTPPSPAPTSPAPAGPATAPPGQAATGDGRVKASPIAKRIARDRGLDLHGVSGSGPGGRIVKADVERALAAGPAAAPGGAPSVAAQPPAEQPAAQAEPAAPTPGVSEKPETAKGQARPSPPSTTWS